VTKFVAATAYGGAQLGARGGSREAPATRMLSWRTSGLDLRPPQGPFSRGWSAPTENDHSGLATWAASI